MIPQGYNTLTTNVPWWLVVGARNRWHIVNFVECGAGYGHTSAIASEMFQYVWAIELNSVVFEQQVPELLQAQNVTRLQGNTLDILPDLCREINQPTLWYLDSHYPGVGPRLSRECPLLEELAILRIRGERLSSDIVVIDDYGLFERPPPPPNNPNEWPTAVQIRSALLVTGLITQVVGDVIFSTPGPLWGPI